MAKLTIFITNSKSGAFYEIATGWYNSFKLGGHNVTMWDGDPQTWHRLIPDIFIGCSGWRQTPPSDHKARIAIHVNPYCNSIVQVPGGPVINEAKVAIDWTLQQKPLFVFGYGTQEDVERLWFKWHQNHGINIIGMPNAADITKYKPIPKNHDYICDIGWVGGYWGYKAINLDKYLIPIAKRHHTIWLGWSGPSGLWKGKATQDQVLSLFNSAKVCPCVVEPHTTKFGIDIPERIFKVAACGALTISDPIYGIDRLFSKDVLPTASDPSSYHQLVEMYINMDEASRKKQANIMRSKVLHDHTYLNRAQTFLRAFGYNNEANEYDILISKACENL